MAQEIRRRGGPAESIQDLPALVRRVRAEYREMPGLVLTRCQMQRMWGIDPSVCDTVIESLVRARVVRRVGNDRYVAA